MADIGTTSRKCLRILAPSIAERAWLRRYGAAIPFVAVAWLVRDAFTPLLSSTSAPFIFFFPAVAAAARLGGSGPGVLAIILSLGAVPFSVTESISRAEMGPWGNAAAGGAFSVSCALIIAGFSTMRRSVATDIRENEGRPRELARASDSLATTLARSGDALMVMDESGNITFLHRETECRSSVGADDGAKGYVLSDVFHIINAYTRAAPERDGNDVFRTGRVVGLAIIVRRK